ncbi:putative inorganic phosphate cotransporter [Spodoptera litura]|uniref:Inorganic phosphate cotransporter n=1 Tax=Spodoptera litura TaxID=69820 RepID=A0A9J7J6I1_SPOLT|nr:putative inorganic phosphate cotransporter [Spodoptera litura]
MDVEFLRYQFEDGYYGVITKNGFKIGVRHIQMMYMLASAISMGFIRGSMGVAVLAVIDPTRRDDTYIKIHNWDGKIQGSVLSSFFFGYALMVLPSELYLRRFGGKLQTTVILLINGVLCVAMPTIINKGGWVAACNAMLFMGMTHACFHTVNRSLFEQWMPPNERKIFSCLIYGGVQIGIITALPISGLLSSAPLGWELVYYALAMLALSMAIISGTLTASSPGDHQAVGDAEMEFIKSTLVNYKKKEINRPWREILKSMRFWAVAGAHASSNAIFVFFIVHTPSYLLTYGLSLENSAWYSMFPFIAMAATYTVLSPFIDWVYTIRYIHYIFSASFFRKLINGLGAFGIVMGLTVLPNFPREWSCPAILVVTAILALLGFQFCGFLSTYKDMSENYCGTLMTISCTVSSAVGAAVPFVAGLILGDDMSNVESWRVIMLSLASLHMLSSVIYTTCASNERQHWDHINNHDKHRLGHYNGVMDHHQVPMEEYGHVNLGLQRHELDTAL